MSGLEILAAAASAAGALSAGRASAGAAGYNARIAEYQAAEAQRRAGFEERRVRERARSLLSAQQARFAAAGVDPSTGTPLLVQEDSAVQAEIDALAVRYGGLAEAGAQRMRAGLDRMEAAADRRAGQLGAGRSLLGAGTSLWPIGSGTKR